MTDQAGATPPAEGTEPTATATVTPPGTTGAEHELGPEGQKALEAFKTRARKAEREAKDALDRLAKLEESSKTDTEKALDAARKEARAEAVTEFEKERRSDRLQVAVARRARELADVDDVVLNIERGDLDDLFDDEGKVKTKALDARLDELLKTKPHLKAGPQGRPSGDADAGKGEGGSGSTFNDEIRARARG